MSNGNLDCLLHPPNEQNNQRRLNLIQRLNIAIDIACGFDYLHNHCEPPIAQCDLKPSNILLDDDMVAHVGDFRLARFMLEESNDQIFFSQTMSLALKGSIGYILPEYGAGGRISTEWDVCSYKILLLEMIIGKRPIDETFCNSVDIHLVTEMALSQGVMNIVDPSLLYEEIAETG
ncbi:probable LRR receptor-like serine/threonine-protein kinase At3g47570 [Benincasa hispida]|uniref:probable LRR receptor-like serine/threonine-protein kinase At3g47570 n=1 Tax=Benincasa hispida TaxID=102211 RepID=UPI001900640E|nr:probable LRR receptor-like serine/threonine-protein kinase At3g47570 [Benincasa hispida]